MEIKGTCDLNRVAINTHFTRISVKLKVIDVCYNNIASIRLATYTYIQNNGNN